ncbi:MAG: substrate-binding domain-containing protein, partial [Armatimonadota bacterium]
TFGEPDARTTIGGLVMFRQQWLSAASLCLLMAVAALSGCKKQPPSAPTSGPGPTAGAPGPEYKVALVMKTMTNPFFITMEKGAREAADELGVRLIVQTPPKETDIDKQIDIVRDMISQGVDAICIAPADSKMIIESLLEAKRAGIVVINLDNRVDPEAAAEAGLRLDSYVGADNEEGGYLASKRLADLMGGEGKAAMLEGIQGVDNAEARKRGFLKAMQEHPDIEIVAMQTANWQTEQAVDVMRDILAKNPDLQGLFCANDMMALGAIEAIAAAGKTGEIYVTSYDNLEAAREEIKAGRIDATIEQHPELMGKWGVEFAVQKLNGQSIPGEKLVTLDVITKEDLSGAGPEA